MLIKALAKNFSLSFSLQVVQPRQQPTVSESDWLKALAQILAQEDVLTDIF